LEVFELLVQGLSPSEIGVKLDISDKTVYKHRAAVMEKLNMQSIPELVKLRYSVNSSINPPLKIKTISRKGAKTQSKKNKNLASLASLREIFIRPAGERPVNDEFPAKKLPSFLLKAWPAGQWPLENSRKRIERIKRRKYPLNSVTIR
jgi:hypothetical protein